MRSHNTKCGGNVLIGKIFFEPGKNLKNLFIRSIKILINQTMRTLIQNKLDTGCYTTLQTNLKLIYISLMPLRNVTIFDEFSKFATFV